MHFNTPIYKLKRQAKLKARQDGIKHSEALDRIAVAQGFKSWSDLATRFDEAAPAHRVLERVRPGHLVLIGARPGHGKTLLGLELAAMASRLDRSGYFFTLDETEISVRARSTSLSAAARRATQSVIVDTSDEICANYLIDRLRSEAANALAVVDYLQLLDQKRCHAPLDEQINVLRRFTRQSGAILVVISQIDRAFDLSGKSLPGIEDIRLPNPLDLSLFDTRCFLHDGNLRIDRAA